MIQHQILITDLQGNIKQLDRRIYNRIFRVKGLNVEALYLLCSHSCAGLGKK